MAPKWLHHRFDAALTDERRLVTKVNLDRIQYLLTIKGAHAAEIANGFTRISNLVGFTRHQTLANSVYMLVW